MENDGKPTRTGDGMTLNKDERDILSRIEYRVDKGRYSLLGQGHAENDVEFLLWTVKKLQAALVAMKRSGPSMSGLLKSIAQLHKKAAGMQGMTYDYCMECERLWPCDTYHLAMYGTMVSECMAANEDWCPHESVSLTGHIEENEAMVEAMRQEGA